MQAALNPFEAPLVNLTPAQAALLDELTEINGQDAYSVVAASIGTIGRSEYLALPAGYDLDHRPMRQIGKGQGLFGVNSLFSAQVYALNKARAPAGCNAVLFGLIRLEAVRLGWYQDQQEVMVLDPLPNAQDVFAQDLTEIRNAMALARQAAFIIPLVSEYIFRTTGHHFVTGQTAVYVEKYRRVLEASLCPALSNILPPTVLYHSVLHWVTPGVARMAIEAIVDHDDDVGRVPDAIRVRMDAAPAGTAIITTTAAVLSAMEADNILEPIAAVCRIDLNSIREKTQEIKRSPTRYHKAHFAYGAARLTAPEKASFEAAQNAAAAFAPIAQAYIDALLNDAALGKAQALKKHAVGNPIQNKHALKLFREAARKGVNNFAELFAN